MRSALMGSIDRDECIGRDEASTSRRFTPGQESPQPLARCRWRHRLLGCRLREADPFESHPSHHLDSTGVRESGMFVDVYPVGFLQDEGLVISSLSDSVRVNTRYNVLKLHS